MISFKYFSFNFWQLLFSSLWEIMRRCFIMRQVSKSAEMLLIGNWIFRQTLNWHLNTIETSSFSDPKQFRVVYYCTGISYTFSQISIVLFEILEGDFNENQIINFYWSFLVTNIFAIMFIVFLVRFNNASYFSFSNWHKHRSYSRTYTTFSYLLR